MIKKQDQKSKIAILGFGGEGQAIFKFLSANKNNFITICDKKSKSNLIKDIPDLQMLKNLKNSTKDNPRWQCGKNWLKNLKSFDVIYRSPGVPYTTKEITLAQKSKIIVSSSTKLFMEQCHQTIIGITGTKGKSTTASILYNILKQNKLSVKIGGNMGVPLISILPDKNPQKNIIVAELSSYQLQDLTTSPHIAIVLNIESEHLNVHKNINEYFQAKANILRYQTKQDYAILNADHVLVKSMSNITPAKIYYFSSTTPVENGCFIKNQEIIWRKNNKERKILNLNQISLRGKHNLENILAAITASMILRPTIKLEQALKKFKGLPHRLEFIKQIKGVKYYNDSAATTPIATIAAIQELKPNVLILGGSFKNANYRAVCETILKNQTREIILIGETAQIIKQILQKIVNTHKTKYKLPLIHAKSKNMANIIATINTISQPNDIVLLSPASASFGMFVNYVDRGNQFKKGILEEKQKVKS